MLSPSHPGPYKATHLTMCDRTVNFSKLSIVCACYLSACRCRGLLRLHLTARQSLRLFFHRPLSQLLHQRQLRYRWSTCRDAYPKTICLDPSDCFAHCKLDLDNGSYRSFVRTVYRRNVCTAFVLLPGALSTSTPTNRKYLLTPFSLLRPPCHSFGNGCANV